MKNWESGTPSEKKNERESEKKIGLIEEENKNFLFPRQDGDIWRNK